MSRRTQGTALWVIAPTVADPTKVELLKIGVTGSFKPGTDSKAKIEDTPLEEEVSKRYMAGGGLRDYGAATFDINADPSNATHVRLKQLEEENAELIFVVGWAGKTKGAVKDIVPALDVITGALTLPPGRSWNKFNGYVESFPMDFDADTAVKSSVSIQRTSKVDWITETA